MSLEYMYVWQHAVDDSYKSFCSLKIRWNIENTGCKSFCCRNELQMLPPILCQVFQKQVKISESYEWLMEGNKQKQI